LLVRKGNFHRVQVAALNVLDQGHFEHLLVVGQAHKHGHAFQTRELGGAEPAFARDDLEAVGFQAADGNGLNDAELANRFGQFRERTRLKLGAGLLGVGLYLTQSHLKNAGYDVARAGVLRRHGGVVVEERGESAAQGGAFRCGHAQISEVPKNKRLRRRLPLQPS
jgi:hypothetical protein